MASTDVARSQGVTLTPTAAAKISELIDSEENNEMVLRLGVKRSGCSGFAYDLFFDSTVEPSDIVNETDGVRIAVDAESAEMVAGAVMDFKDDGESGSGFAIENPNESGSCGCGNSSS